MKTDEFEIIEIDIQGQNPETPLLPNQRGTGQGGDMEPMMDVDDTTPKQEAPKGVGNWIKSKVFNRVTGPSVFSPIAKAFLLPWGLAVALGGTGAALSLNSSWKKRGR